MLMLFAIGLARLGYFRGDGFTACAVVGCATLLVLFIAFPLCKGLVGALQDDQGTWSLLATADRLFNEKVWGLACLAGGNRCGVVWNTLFLGLATAAGTTLLGLLLALLAERGSSTGKAHSGTWLKLLALLPIITPPFVIGLGLILLLGRAGLVNQFLEYAFGVTPGRWLYGVQGVWLAQMFAFTPVAFLVLRGVVQGISPSLEEAAQTLRANPRMTFNTVTLPLLRPGIANAFLVGFIERADVAAVDASRRALDVFFRQEAKSIRDKYVEPPYTTDFAILFLPTEGLYAEAVARPGLSEALQREFRVTLAGPTTLAAMLNSLQLGFRTLAIEKRSTEVWRVLGAVKTEFGRFGDILARTRERLDAVDKTLDDAGRKSTTIARKLREVEALPDAETDRLLGVEGTAVIDVETEGEGREDFGGEVK